MYHLEHQAVKLLSQMPYPTLSLFQAWLSRPKLQSIFNHIQNQLLLRWDYHLPSWPVLEGAHSQARAAQPCWAVKSLTNSISRPFQVELPRILDHNILQRPLLDAPSAQPKSLSQGLPLVTCWLHQSVFLSERTFLLLHTLLYNCSGSFFSSSVTNFFSLRSIWPPCQLRKLTKSFIPPWRRKQIRTS